MSLTFFALLSALGFIKDSAVTVNISLDGLPVNIVRVYQPDDYFFNGTENLNYYDVKGSNNFNIKVPLKTPSFIEIGLNNESYLLLAAVPGDSIHVSAVRRQPGNYPDYTYSFSGDNALAHTIYEERFHPAGKNLGYLDDLPKNTFSYKEYFLKSKIYIDSVTSVWDSLSQAGHIEEPVYQLYKADTKGCLYDVAIRRMSLVKPKDTGWVSYTQWLNLKQVMFYYADAANPVYLKTYVGTHLYDTYLRNIFEKDSSVTDTVLRASDIGNFYYYDTIFREKRWGEELIAFKKMFPGMQDKVDSKAFEKFYPNSIYLRKLKAYDDSIINERKSVAGDIVINTKDYDNIKDLLKAIDGRYFFIDIWATWCIPCIQEFNNYTALSKYLNSVNIKKVFLSVDEKNNEQKWKDFIQSQHLAGYHFIINDTIQKQLFDIFSEGKAESSFFIPQYLLYDKETGKFSVDLPRPSTGYLLQSVIDDILKGDSKKNEDH